VRAKSPGDLIFQLLCQFSGAAVLGIAAMLLVTLVGQAWPVLSHANEYRVFTSTEWNPDRKVTFLVTPTGEREYAPETDPAFRTEGDGKDLKVFDAKTNNLLEDYAPEEGKDNRRLVDSVTDIAVGEFVVRAESRFGAWVFIYGTVATALIAMLIAIPLGVGSAAYLSEIAPPWMRKTFGFFIELLAAIPSVVYGFWGLFFLSPALQKVFGWLGAPNTASGQGILAAGIILAIMVIPYITAISFDVCRAVPTSQRQGALALGATRWQMIRGVVLPYAKPGVVAACFLALGRALGETMAVTMLIGNVRYLDFSIFATGDSIASIIANQLNEAGSEQHRAALITLGLILFLITVLTNVIARLLIRRKPKVRVDKPVDPATVAADGPKKYDVLRIDPSVDASLKRQNSIMTFVLFCCQFFTVVPLFLILGYIGYQGVSGLSIDFLTQLPKPPGEEGGGLGNAIVGSLVLVVLSSLVAVPLGVLCAVFLHEYGSNPMAKPARFTAEILGGVPSIIIGIFAYAILVNQPWGTRPYGFSAWAGVFALGIMMLPVVIRTSEESIKLVPKTLRQASYALGASQWQTVVKVILPAALSSIITGVLLAMGRIAGETAPLILTVKGSRFWVRDPGEPIAFLPGAIYEYSKSPDEILKQQAWAAAVVLLSAVLLLNIVIRIASGKRQNSAAASD